MKKTTPALLAVGLLLPLLLQMPLSGAERPREIPSASATDWPMFGASVERGGFSPSDGPVTDNVLWSRDLGSDMGSGPAVVNGTVYIGQDKYLRAFDASNGSPGWVFTAPVGRIETHPLVYRGMVFVGTEWGDGNLYAINAVDGSLAWKTVLGEMYTTSPLAVDDLIITGTNDKGIFALFAANGTIAWHSTESTYMHSTIAYHDGVIYGANGQVFAMRASDRQVLWREGQGESSVVYCDGLVIAHDPGTISAFNATTGKTVWTQEFEEHAWNAITSGPAVGFGRVFVGVQGDTSGGNLTGKVHAYDLHSGAEAWTATVDGDVMAAPAISANGILYVSARSLHAIDIVNGSIIWTHMLTGYGTTVPPSIACKTVYAGGGPLIAFRDLPVNASNPGAPRDLRAKAGNRQVTLNWVPPVSDGRSAITGYRIFRATSSGAETLLTSVGLTTTYMDTGLENNNTYYYKVSAQNGIGEGPMSNEASATPRAELSAPLDLTAKPGNKVVTLKWNIPAEDGSSPVQSYNVYRGKSSGGEVLLIGGRTTRTYEDTGVQNGVVYYYQVSAVNGYGEGPRSNEASAQPAGMPGAPSMLVARGGDLRVFLAWNSPSDTGGSPVTGYRIYRSVSPGVLSFFNGTGNVTGYEDTAVQNGITYHYQVSALTDIGEGSRSNEAKARPMGLPSAPLNLTATPGNTRVLLEWKTPASDGGSPITGYGVYRRTLGTREIKRNIGVQLTYDDPGLQNGETYYYRVSATAANGEGQTSEEVRATPLAVPSEPKNPVVYVSGRTVTLNWEKPADDGGHTIMGYNVYRNGSFVDRANSLSYADVNVTDGRQYTYRVTAVNSIGESPPSKEVTASLKTLKLKCTASFSQPRVSPGGIIYLTVRVEDDQFAPIAGANVSWGLSANVGALSPMSRKTDINGTATFTFSAFSTQVSQTTVKVSVLASKAGYSDDGANLSFTVLNASASMPYGVTVEPWWVGLVIATVAGVVYFLMVWRNERRRRPAQ